MRTELNIPGQIELNYNETVRVQLTEVGKRRLKEYCDGDIGLYRAYVNKKGLARMQFWSLMHIFGPMMTIGSDAPFVGGNIMFGEKKQTLNINFEPNSG